MFIAESPTTATPQSSQQHTRAHDHRRTHPRAKSKNCFKTSNCSPLRNQQYSIIALTNGSGTITERYAYSAYGTPTITDASGTVLTSSADNNRYTYTGREWDSSLSLYHYRARMYDSVAGRFCSRDSIAEIRALVDCYLFLSNRPFNFLDPLGLFDVDNVIGLLNSDPQSQWVVCCLKDRELVGFDEKRVIQRNTQTGEEGIWIGGGAYFHGTGKIEIDMSKSDTEAASTLIQECMHAKDREYPDDGNDPFNERENELDWAFRREVSGRVYEEEWRIRNGLPPKSGLDGKPIYPNDGRICSDGICNVDTNAITDYVTRNYPNLLSENVQSGGQQLWEYIRTDYVNEQIISNQKFKDACSCPSGSPFNEPSVIDIIIHTQGPKHTF